MKRLTENQPLNNMALGYVLDKGIEFTSQITDDEIENLDGNGLMTKEFVQDLVKLAREYAKSGLDNIVSNIQESFYMNDVLNVNRSSIIIENLIGYIHENHIYEYSYYELINKLINAECFDENELRLIDEYTYEEYQEWIEENKGGDE